MNVIGLDISQKTIDVCLLTRTNKNLYLKIENSEQGCLMLQQYLKSKRFKNLIVSMEATGIYYQVAAKYLSQHYKTHVINPLQIKEYSRTILSKTKTDKADAELIAEFTKRHHDQLIEYYQPSPAIEEIHQLITLKDQLKQQIKETKNRIHAAQHNQFIKDIHQSLLILLEQQLELASNKIELIVKKKNDLNQVYKRMLTIPSIGKDTAIILMYHLINKPFKTANQFTAYAGLNPRIEQSGSSVNRKRKNNYGNRRLKSSLYMPALVAYRMNVFPQLVENLQKSGKPKKLIIGALMRKLLKIAFYIHKSKTDFDAGRHQKI